MVRFISSFFHILKVYNRTNYSMKIGYVRESAQDQNLSLQIDALRVAGCERIYEEKASGAKADRPEPLKMLEHARDGNAIVIWKLDRLGRSLSHLVQIVSDLE